LNNLALDLDRVGSSEQALSCLEEAIGHYRRLAGDRGRHPPARPRDVAPQPRLHEEGIVAATSKHWLPAQEAVTIYRQLAETDPRQPTCTSSRASCTTSPWLSPI
jgi:hypothetical protein